MNQHQPESLSISTLCDFICIQEIPVELDPLLSYSFHSRGFLIFIFAVKACSTCCNIRMASSFPNLALNKSF